MLIHLERRHRYVDFFFYTQESGTLVLPLDALFGLPRKNAAGISHRDSMHGNLIRKLLVSMFLLMRCLVKMFQR